MSCSPGFDWLGINLSNFSGESVSQKCSWATHPKPIPQPLIIALPPPRRLLPRPRPPRVNFFFFWRGNPVSLRALLLSHESTTLILSYLCWWEGCRTRKGGVPDALAVHMHERASPGSRADFVRPALARLGGSSAWLVLRSPPPPLSPRSPQTLHWLRYRTYLRDTDTTEMSTKLLLPRRIISERGPSPHALSMCLGEPPAFWCFRGRGCEGILWVFLLLCARVSFLSDAWMHDAMVPRAFYGCHTLPGCMYNFAYGRDVLFLWKRA